MTGPRTTLPAAAAALAPALPSARPAAGLAAGCRPLVRALLRRALRPAPLAVTLLLVAGLAAALGRDLAARGLLAPLTPFLILPFVVAVALRVVDHVAADDESGWLGQLVAGTPAEVPVVYALAVVGGAAMVAVAHVTAAAIGLGLGAAAAGGAMDGGPAGGLASAGPARFVAAVAAAARLLPGAVALLAAVAAYAGVCALLCRRRGPALALAALGVGVPLAIVGWWQAAGGAPSPAARLLGLHLPLFAWRSDPALLLRQAAYAAAALAVIAWLAPRTVARER